MTRTFSRCAARCFALLVVSVAPGCSPRQPVRPTPPQTTASTLRATPPDASERASTDASTRRRIESAVARATPCLVQLTAPMPPRSSRTLRVVEGAPLEIRRAGPLGTGIVVGHRLVLTAHHVVEHANAIEARFPAGATASATLVARDPRHDLALLQLSAEPSDVQSIPIAIHPPNAGEWVIALGNLYGKGPTVTVGVVSSNHGDATGDGDTLETDAAINLTNTGGPMLNLDGEVVGIANAKLTEQRGMRGLGYGSSARAADAMVANLTTADAPLRRKPPVDGGALRGIRTEDLGAVARRRYAIGEDVARGVVVVEVHPDSPAAHVGIEPGDVLVEMDFEPVWSTGGFEEALEDTSGPILVLIVRGNSAAYVLLHP